MRPIGLYLADYVDGGGRRNPFASVNPSINPYRRLAGFRLLADLHRIYPQLLESLARRIHGVVDSIVGDMDRKYFKVLFSPVHCLHSLLPPVKSNPYGLRSRDHNFQLPVCNSFSRKSFILRSLFRFK